MATGKRERSPYLTVAVLCVPLILTMLQSTVMSTALHDIQSDLKAGISDVQWIVAGYSLTFAALQLTAGTVGDLFGRKKAFVAGLLVFIAGAVASALSTGVTALVVGQLVMGAGAAWIMPTSLSIIRHTFTDPGARAGAIGIWAGLGGAAVAIGPAVGGPMVDHWGWQSIFWAYVPIAALGAAAALAVLRESADPRDGGLDITGTLLSIAWIAAVVYATIEAPDRGWTDARVLAVYGAAAVLLAIFVAVELRAANPMLDLRFFRDKVFAGAVLSGFAVYFGLFSITYYLLIWMQNILGWSATGAGLAILPALLLSMIAAPIAGAMTARLGGGLPLGLGVAVSAVAMWGATLYGAHARYADYWWVVMLVGVGLGLTLTPISVVVMSRVPARRSGMASGAANATRQLGGGIGIAVLGALLTWRMKASAGDRLTAAGVPPQVRDRITQGISSGNGGSGGGSGGIGGLVDQSFVDGLHLAEGTGAIILAVTAVLAFVLVGRKGREDADREDTAAPPASAAVPPGRG